MRHLPKKSQFVLIFFRFQFGKKWFPSLIEHEMHPFGVSKLFFELFIKTSWRVLKILGFLSLDIAPTLDVPVLLLNSAFHCESISQMTKCRSFNPKLLSIVTKLVVISNNCLIGCRFENFGLVTID